MVVIRPDDQRGGQLQALQAHQEGKKDDKGKDVKSSLEDPKDGLAGVHAKEEDKKQPGRVYPDLRAAGFHPDRTSTPRPGKGRRIGLGVTLKVDLNV